MQAVRPRMTRVELINYCYELLMRRGYQVERFVQTGVGGNSLTADLVTRTTVYEFREVLNRPALFAGTGQGLVYAWWLRRRRVVVVGYLPPLPGDIPDALTTIENIERTRYATVSIVDADPFWELSRPSYQWLGYLALLVGSIALAVFAIPLLREEVGCRVYPELKSCAPERAYQPW